jgi:hypothetical protein
MMHKGKAIRAHPLFSGFRFQNLLSALNKSLRARKHLGNNGHVLFFNQILLTNSKT